ncbi:ORF3 [Coffee ringspot virus]|uniref:ORF3 n=1 Tax=Coffee ringspot virus TaxID=745716 RepID=W5URV1_9RHAB|nr:ORF3 [Coffee ringspot virus]AHH44827.1 ORF3 [Coffee ringspot virus]
MSTLPPSVVSGPVHRDEVRETAGRRMASRDESLDEFNRELQTAQAWQRKLIQKHPIRVLGKEGEGKITMIRKPIIINVANVVSRAVGGAVKPIWIVGIAIKWKPSCDLATSGVLKLSIQNKAVNNPVLRDHTVVQISQRVSSAFDIQYTSSSKHNESGNPWSYSYEISNMDDAPVNMELGTAVIMPIIKQDSSNTQMFGGVQCEIYGGHFPLNIPAVCYCAPGPRFKTNLPEIERNVQMILRFLNVQGITDIDEELAYKVIQCCDPETARILYTGVKKQVWSTLEAEGINTLRSLVYDCKSGRAVSYITLEYMRNLGSLGGAKTHTYV